jgi:hypothetical protein
LLHCAARRKSYLQPHQGINSNVRRWFSRTRTARSRGRTRSPRQRWLFQQHCRHAALFKNNAAIDKTQAANSWNYYQAKSSKQNLAELAMTLPGVDPKRYEAEVARYKGEKEDIKKDAEKWEESSKEWNHKSDEAMHQHHQWALATTAEQIAISLAAITLLTRKKWMMGLAYGVAGVGIALGAFAWFHVDPIGALLGGGH